MKYTEFLERVVHVGMERAREEYRTPEDEHALEGAMEGLKACLGGKEKEELWGVVMDSGFVSYVSGGDEIYRVNNFNDSGPGSLREAVSRGRRIVVFDVSGDVNLRRVLKVPATGKIVGEEVYKGAMVEWVEWVRQVFASVSIDDEGEVRLPARALAAYDAVCILDWSKGKAFIEKEKSTEIVEDDISF